MPAPSNSSKVTLTDVARQAGVSVMTASYTYSKPSRVSAASRAKVLAAAEQLGYPGPDPSARSLRRGTSGALGVVLGEALRYAFEDPQATRFLAGIAEVCGGHGLAMTILPLNGSADDVQRIRAAAVDGFVVWTTTEDDPVLEALALTGKPVVIHAGPQRNGFGLVGIDDRSAAEAVAAAGLAGSRRPAVISFPGTRERADVSTHGPDPGASTFPVTRHRLQGFKDAVVAAGFDWNQVEVVFCPTNSAADGERAMRRLLSSGAVPDTVLTMSDELAVGALRAAAEQGLAVPLDLAVTGWDASDAAAAAGLTTVRQDLRTQGAASARAALQGAAVTELSDWQVVRGRSTR